MSARPTFCIPRPKPFIYNFVGFYRSDIPEDEVRNLLRIFDELCQQENIDQNDAYCAYAISAPYPEGIHETPSIVSIRSTEEVPEEKLMRIKTILKDFLTPWVIKDPNHPANRSF